MTSLKGFYKVLYKLRIYFHYLSDRYLIKIAINIIIRNNEYMNTVRFFNKLSKTYLLSLSISILISLKNPDYSILYNKIDFRLAHKYLFAILRVIISVSKFNQLNH